MSIELPRAARSFPRHRTVADRTPVGGAAGRRTDGARHGAASRLARCRLPAAGGPRRRARQRAGLPRAHSAQVPARSVASQGHGCGRSEAGSGGAGRGEDRHLWRLRCRRCHLGRAAHALFPGGWRQHRDLHSRPPQGRLRTQCAGAPEAQGAGRHRRGDGRLRRHGVRAAGRGAPGRSRHDRHRPSHGGDGSARGDRRRRPQPSGR